MLFVAQTDQPQDFMIYVILALNQKLLLNPSADCELLRKLSPDL